MSGAHTPGPWVEDEAGLFGPGGEGICQIIVSDEFFGTPRDELPDAEVARCIANARLISAAPELLEALRHIVNGALSLPRFAEEQARAAIAKAEGREP